MKLCKYCNEPIVLVPSAAERARKFGGKPSDYTDSFDAHADCIIAKRNAQIKDLIARNVIRA